ncbi:MAG: CRISPR-associated endonuclease Cas2 [Bdellovibrio sp.]|nr:CRISPR-associated endonuclease Cas2 [Bdellovibrio sp.]
MRLLICFDVSDDKIRRTLVGVLEAYATRCQFSVFEAEMPMTVYQTMKQEISAIQLGADDKLFIYPIPNEEDAKILRIGAYLSAEKIYVF